MNVAAILLAIGTTPQVSTKWVIQSGIVGKRFVVRVRKKNKQRGEFVEARHFLTPWQCQARKFEDQAKAEAFAEILEPAIDESIDVRSFEDVWHEEVLDDRWCGTRKIGPIMPDHDRPLLELVRLYAKALEAKLHLAHIMPAALGFSDPTKVIELASLGSAGAVKVSESFKKLQHTWRDRLHAAGVSTTALLIVEGPAAEKIANETQKLGSRVIAIGTQHQHENRLLGGLLRDETTLLCDAPCPVLISEAAEVILS